MFSYLELDRLCSHETEYFKKQRGEEALKRSGLIPRATNSTFALDVEWKG